MAVPLGTRVGIKPTSRPSVHFPDRGVWSGARGYLFLYWPDHPCAMGNGLVSEHVAVVCRAMGKPLPKGAEVHHVNGIRADNSPGNLVACEDLAYHKHLHVRQAALDACGHAEWRRCHICKQHDDPSRLRRVSQRARAAYRHRACHANRERAARRRNR